MIYGECWVSTYCNTHFIIRLICGLLVGNGLLTCRKLKMRFMSTPTFRGAKTRSLRWSFEQTKEDVTHCILAITSIWILMENSSLNAPRIVYSVLNTTAVIWHSEIGKEKVFSKNNSLLFFFLLSLLKITQTLCIRKAFCMEKYLLQNLIKILRKSFLIWMQTRCLFKKENKQNIGFKLHFLL